MNRNVDQPYKYVGIWVVDQLSKIGVHATSTWCRPAPGSRRSAVAISPSMSAANCHSVVNPVIDIQPYLPTRSTRRSTPITKTRRARIYHKVLHETDPKKQHEAMLPSSKWESDTQAHSAFI